MSALFLKLVNMSLSASWLVLALLALRLALKGAEVGERPAVGHGRRAAGAAGLD